ncbi:MAG: lactate utilization protein, partial [Chloroflexota bacterium]
MTSGTDLTLEKQWLSEQHARTVVNNLQKKNISAQYVPGRQEALAAVLNMIPAGVTVARGDSISVDQIGIIEELKKRKQEVIDPHERNADGSYLYPDIKQRNMVARKAFTADVYLVGTNAVTLDGKLVNIDAWGNRVSAMIFGPEKVIIVAGVNKIVRDADEGIARIHNIAAPMNAKRHFLKHNRTDFGNLPCARTGTCINCNNDWRLCRYTVIIEGSMIREKGRINVVLVGEEL